MSVNNEFEEAIPSYLLDEINEENKDLLPSTCYSKERLYSFNTSDCIKHDLICCGKWMIFRPRATIDEAWKKISVAVQNGQLGSEAFVSTVLSEGKIPLIEVIT